MMTKDQIKKSYYATTFLSTDTIVQYIRSEEVMKDIMEDNWQELHRLYLMRKNDER